MENDKAKEYQLHFPVSDLPETAEEVKEDTTPTLKSLFQAFLELFGLGE